MFLDQKIIDLLKDSELPESIRESIVNQIFTGQREERSNSLEKEKLDFEKKNSKLNTPLVAALAGLITLSATFVFDRIAARGDTANSIALQEFKAELERLSANANTSNNITLAEFQSEFEKSETRLKQELDKDSSVSLARIEAEAREREFQYEVVRLELNRDERTNAERAAVLLFLVRAGVLNQLNPGELKLMAEEQQANPEQDIIPRLSSETSSPLNMIDLNSNLGQRAEVAGAIFVSSATDDPIEEIATRIGIMEGGSVSVIGKRKNVVVEILKAARALEVSDTSHLAYILATAYHETNLGLFMQELWGPTAAQKTYGSRLGNRSDAEGKLYLGRGFVQITGRDNYQKYSDIFGQDFISDPQLVATLPVASQILVGLMTEFGVTNKGVLQDFGSEDGFDFFNARGIVNGDKHISGDDRYPGLSTGQGISRKAIEYREILVDVLIDYELQR